MSNTDTTKALTTIINALMPLTSDERHRTVDSAMLFLGETPSVQAERKSLAADQGNTPSGGGYPPRITSWMKKYGVSADELDQVFHFKDDGSFDIHDAPGKSKKEKSLNTYILTGVGKYLTSDERVFDDALAREFCQTIGCFDQANHAAHLKDKGPEFSGGKSKGYSITNAGVKRGAALVKELASVAK